MNSKTMRLTNPQIQALFLIKREVVTWTKGDGTTPDAYKYKYGRLDNRTVSTLLSMNQVEVKKTSSGVFGHLRIKNDDPSKLSGGLLHTTLNAILTQEPCTLDWHRLLEHVGKKKADDEELLFLTILEVNGLDSALWCCRAAPQYSREWRLYAVSCARKIQHIMLDRRSIDALDVAERFAKGNASKPDLERAALGAHEAATPAAIRDAVDKAYFAAEGSRHNAFLAAKTAFAVTYSAAHHAALSAFQHAEAIDSAYTYSCSDSLMHRDMFLEVCS
jgi:hypothetical protein